MYYINYVYLQMPLMNLVRKQTVILSFLATFCVTMIIISLTSSIGFPYRAGPNEPALQRYWIMVRQTNNNNSYNRKW